MLAWIQRRLGAGILRAAPILMKGLSIAGTAAMFLVGAGMIVHGVPRLHHWVEGLAEGVAALPGIGDTLRPAMSLLLNAVIGIVTGGLVLAVVSGGQHLMGRASRP
jgi:predicted DNA repair protein MutK